MFKIAVAGLWGFLRSVVLVFSAMFLAAIATIVLEFFCMAAGYPLWLPMSIFAGAAMVVASEPGT